MMKVWYNIYMECIKESAGLSMRAGEKMLVGKIKSEGLAYQTCKSIQESVGEYFKVYYE